MFKGLKVFASVLDPLLERHMASNGEQIAEEMRRKLQADGHVDTGALLNSIRSETERTGHQITTRVYADAKSENGAMYAEFIELGTGAAHGRPGGRTGTWRYMDRSGHWHTTDGMDADPFIEPAVNKVLTGFDRMIEEVTIDAIRYGRGGTQ